MREAYRLYVAESLKKPQKAPKGLGEGGIDRRRRTRRTTKAGAADKRAARLLAHGLIPQRLRD